MSVDTSDVFAYEPRLAPRAVKSAATTASGSNGPFRPFYENLLGKGMKPELARLTLARKIAAITLHVWKKGEPFDAEYLKSQAA